MSAAEMPAPGDVPFLSAAGDVPHVPAVWGGPLMSDAPRGVKYHGLLCLLGLWCSASLCFARIVACAFTRIDLRDNAHNRANICQIWLNNDSKANIHANTSKCARICANIGLLEMENFR